MKLTLDKRKGECENSIKYHTKLRLTVPTTFHKGKRMLKMTNKEWKSNKQKGIRESYREEQSFKLSKQKKSATQKTNTLT